MRQKLVVTLTTTRGSRQYTLSQLAGWLLGVFLILSAISFFVSNLLLVKTRDDLSGLEERYTEVLGSQQLYIDSLTELSQEYTRTFFELSQLEEEKLRLDTDLSQLEVLLNLTDTPALDDSPERQAERRELLRAATVQRLFLLHSVPNGLPIRGTRVSSNFGTRINPVTGQRSPHNGIDFPAPRGTPIYATADGIVEQAGFDHGSGFGNLIIIQHNLGFRTYYAHLHQVQVKAGDFVHKGQQIGLSGNTGRSTGPHLHYEVRHLYTPLNPYDFVKWGPETFESLFSATEDKIAWESLNALYPLNQTAPQ